MAVFVDGKWVEPEGEMSDGEGADTGTGGADGAATPDGADAPDDTGEVGDTGSTDGDGADDGASEGDKLPQSAEENARQAEGRRRREAAAAEARRLAAAEVSALLAELDLRDDDGSPITTPDRAREYAANRRIAKLNESLRAGELTLDDINLLRGAPVPAQTAAAPDTGADVAALVAEQLTRIAADYNPGIKSIDDILAMDTGEAFQAHVRAGQDFYGAYKLANAEAIAEAKAAAKLRQQQHNTASKSHLQSSRGKSGEAILTPPKEVAETYKRFFPEATNDEIARIYTARRRAGK
ncbi:MAG: hypothetical protein LBC21_04640 [Oscillospiraceae bacterium]|jgi:hypothetical protein|nr:hypothetical protein [Oscillospiraceae bacterium]